jgi:hypothetical protein
VYAWALNHAAELGWTGERIVLVGDSAGGNLIMSMTLRAVSMRLRRMPNGTRSFVWWARVCRPGTSVHAVPVPIHAVASTSIAHDGSTIAHGDRQPMHCW